jgi:DNA-binding NarL/FixJ family response regulator
MSTTGVVEARASSIVIVMEPNTMIRAGVATMLEEELHLEVVATATLTEALAVAATSEFKAATLLLSLDAGGREGVREVIKRLRMSHPDLRILAMGNGRISVAVFLTLAAGADGYIDKLAPTERFVGAVLRGVSGDIEFDLDGGSSEVPRLTAREIDVLEIVAEGLTAAQIGQVLGIAPRTVGTYLGRIYRKLGVNGKIAALSVAARDGLVSSRASTAAARAPIIHLPDVLDPVLIKGPPEPAMTVRV